MEQQRSSTFFGDVAFAGNILILLARNLAIAPAVFMRTHLGSRFLSVPQMIGCYLFLEVYVNFSPTYSQATSYLLPCLGLLCLCHRIATHIRQSHGEDIHTHIAGDPRPFWYQMGLTPKTAPFADTALWTFLGLIIRGIDSQLGSYMLISGLSLFTFEMNQFLYWRKTRKDTQDKTLEGRATGQIMQNKPAFQQGSSTVELFTD